MSFPITLMASGIMGHWSLFSLLGLDHHYSHVVMAALATIFIVYLSLRIYRAYKEVGDEALVPSDRLTLRNVAEMVVESLYNMFEGILGEHTPKYFPFLASIFIFILVNNVMGIIPGFLPSTDNLSTQAGIALLVFIYYHREGWRAHGFAYLKHFTGPVIWIAPLMVIIELVSHIARPVALTLRLFGNISGDHLVLGIFSDLTPFFVPIVFLGLGLFVAFVQAFVFTLLSTIYISLAISHE